jgi:hypothetical protein
MALKLLNPGLRPLGLFDLDDGDSGDLVGGEYVQLQAMDTDDVEAYAADVGQLDDTTAGGINFGLATCVHENLGGLADEGTDEYGTLFGSLIGSNVGRATASGTVGGAVVIGPSTDRASGKVTVWAQAGLYGVTGQDADLDTNGVANDPVHATAAGLLTTVTDVGDSLGCYVGAMTDTSLVSTTNAAVGVASATEYHAIFFFGNTTVPA